jgi:hypothetical protein
LYKLIWGFQRFDSAIVRLTVASLQLVKLEKQERLGGFFEMPFIVSGTCTELDASPEEIDRRRQERLAQTPTRRGVTKSKAKQTRSSVTDTMETDAEKLVSAAERGLIKFESILPRVGMPVGGLGVGPGSDRDKDVKAFGAYIKQDKVIARLVSEGFVRSGGGAPHLWYLVRGKGVVSPIDKVLCRSLTSQQHKEIETKRLHALALRKGTPQPCEHDHCNTVTWSRPRSHCPAQQKR